MFVSVAFVGIMIFTAFFAFTSYKKDQQLLGARDNNQKLLVSSNELLKANEMLSEDRIRPEHIETYLVANPEAITKEIATEVFRKEPELLLKVIKRAIELEPKIIPADLAAEVLKKNPGVITDKQMAAFVETSPKLDAWIGTYLEEHGMSHSWKNVGNREFSGTINGSSVKGLTLKIEKCTRCGMFHKFVLGSNDPKITGWKEGYFVGATPIEIKDARPPKCLH